MNTVVRLAFLLSFQAPDLPELSDLWRFPPGEVADAQWAVADDCHRRFSKMAGLGPTWFPDQDVWLCHSNYCRECWADLMVAQCAGCEEGYRRERLRSLRNRLGDACYYSGWMPPAVPLWLFREADPLPAFHRHRRAIPPIILTEF